MPKENRSEFLNMPENVSYKAFTPNGVARDKGKNPEQQRGQDEGTTSTGGGWTGNRTGE